MNKGKPHSKWSWEDLRGSFHTHTTHQFTHSSQKKINLQQEEGRFSSCLETAQPMRGCHNLANGKIVYFKLPVSSKGLFAYNSPTQLFPSL